MQTRIKLRDSLDLTVRFLEFLGKLLDDLISDLLVIHELTSQRLECLAAYTP